jgi:hypothetical protein
MAKKSKWSPFSDSTASSSPLDILSATQEQPEEVSPTLKESEVDQTPNEGEPIIISHMGLPINPLEELEKAANLILALFPSGIREFAEEVADIVLKIPRWQLVAGSLLTQHDMGMLVSPTLDPGWRTMEKIPNGKEICTYPKCSLPNREFVPKRYGQKYCSNECSAEDRKSGRVSP